jgi:Flp pilus assembly protein protease CpaA
MIEYMAVLLGLLYASYKDLATRMVHDKVFILPFVVAVVIGGYMNGLGYAGSMVVQGILAVLVGLIFKFVRVFGGADILGIGLAASVFPDTLLFIVLAWLLVPMVVWLKMYSFVTRSRKGPALPGIFIGFILFMSSTF